jgi:alpha-glucosidase
VTWWREAVFYQIYPRSFLDTDGDGVGDLAGVAAKLGYLAELGVDALWITPIYPSPMKDFGYDVSDYCDVDARYGSLADFDELVATAHRHGLRVILDWVPNHTSSEHPWFRDARSSRTSSHRDWYVWREPTVPGVAPNNWLRSWSDESAWTLDDATGQYYLHCFLPDQPDLNWANVEVREAMAETLRFWLARGVDGFRMDVIHLLGKDPALADDPEDLVAIGHVPLNDRPETHEYLREIRRVLGEFDGERVSVGEVYLLDPEAVATYYGHGDELHLSFNFASLVTPWRAEAWRALIERTEAAHGARDAWPTWVLSNHDNQRIATRLKGDRQRVCAAMVLLLTLRGTPFVYAGEELGLLDAVIPPERVVDPGLRDGCRAPIPWTRGGRHGWAGDPWLPFAGDADDFAVEVQRERADSMLAFVRETLALRRSLAPLRLGSIESVSVHDDVLAYARVLGDERVEVRVNFAREPREVAVGESLALRLSGTGDAVVAAGALSLAAGEAAVLVARTS